MLTHLGLTGIWVISKLLQMLTTPQCPMKIFVNYQWGGVADDNSILFLWATFPKIQEALDVIKAWGFEYKTVGFTWIKKNKNGGNFFGVGWYTKSNAEVCLIGTKGKAPKQSNSVSQIVETTREEHSRKPAIIRDKIVEFCGDLPRIELFARNDGSKDLFNRNPLDGWDAWGNEVKSDITLSTPPPSLGEKEKRDN